MDTKLLLIAVAPVIALGTAICLLDRREKEPIFLLAKIYLLGALAVIPVYFMQKILLNFNLFGGILSVAFVAFIVAGLVEEYAKRAVTLHIAYKNKNFNERIDGIVYSVFSALGFATVENIMYIIFVYTGNFYVGIMRGVLSVPAHVLFAITMGYYISLAKFEINTKLRRGYLLKSLMIPVLLHGSFNFILMSKIPSVMLFFVPFLIYLWIANIKKLRKLSKVNENNHNYEDKN
ncbi:MAG: PrsW family intramembrane metalloprotease [Alkaliphilus sp.]